MIGRLLMNKIIVWVKRERAFLLWFITIKWVFDQSSSWAKQIEQ